jgi:hypothetical protein
MAFFFHMNTSRGTTPWNTFSKPRIMIDHLTYEINSHSGCPSLFLIIIGSHWNRFLKDSVGMKNFMNESEPFISIFSYFFFNYSSRMYNIHLFFHTVTVYSSLSTYLVIVPWGEDVASYFPLSVPLRAPFPRSFFLHSPFCPVDSVARSFFLYFPFFIFWSSIIS